VNGFDIALAIAAVAAFVGGYHRGLLARLLIWIGAVLGLFLAASNIGAVLRIVGNPPRERRLVTMLLVLIGGLLIGRVVGQLAGSWIQSRLPTKPLRSVNRIAGGVFGVAGVLAIAWIALPLLAQIPGWPSTNSRTSIAAKLIEKRLPQPPDTLASLRRLVDGGQFPLVLRSLERALDTGELPQIVNFDPLITDAVSQSTVQVSSEGCGVVSEGSAFTIGGSRLITAAHVVSGGKVITLTKDDGTTFSAQVVAIDAVRDLALLSAQTWTAPGLPLVPAEIGKQVAIMGYRNGGPQQIVPGGIREVLTLEGRDIYDRAKTERPVVVLASKLASGDSGAAVIDESGNVMAMAFAVAPDRSTTGYAVASEQIQAFLAEVDEGTRGVLPGACLVR
jgi:S1-C subfamily serine protease